MPKHQARAEQTRRAILDAVIDVIYEAGYHNLSIRRVLKQADISHGTLLHHFPTKEVLVAEAILRLGFQEAVDSFQKMRQLQADEESIEAGLEIIKTIYTSKRFFVTLELIVAARTDPKLQIALAPIQDRIRALVEVLRLDPKPGKYTDHDLRRDIIVHAYRSMALDRLVSPARMHDDAFLEALNRFLFPEGWVTEPSEPLVDMENDPSNL